MLAFSRRHFGGIPWRVMSLRAATTGSVGASGPPGKPAQIVDRVLDRIVDRLARGELAPGFDPLSSTAGSPGSAGEAGGGERQVPRAGVADSGGGGGFVTYDYEAVPRSIDIDAFRRALSSALTEHVGATGGGAGLAMQGGGEMARRLMAASPTERQAIAEKVANDMADNGVEKLLSEEPVPVVRSRLAGMLQRSGFF